MTWTIDVEETGFYIVRDDLHILRGSNAIGDAVSLIGGMFWPSVVGCALSDMCDDEAYDDAARSRS